MIICIVLMVARAVGTSHVRVERMVFTMACNVRCCFPLSLDSLTAGSGLPVGMTAIQRSRSVRVSLTAEPSPTLQWDFTTNAAIVSRRRPRIEQRTKMSFRTPL